MKTIRELRDEVMRLNPMSRNWIYDVFNTYLTKSIPPTPGFFEGENLEFPMDNEFDNAYKTISHASYRFHKLDRETLKYINPENHFKYHGFYED